MSIKIRKLRECQSGEICYMNKMHGKSIMPSDIVAEEWEVRDGEKTFVYAMALGSTEADVLNKHNFEKNIPETFTEE